jgi:hypothetical protein
MNRRAFLPLMLGLSGCATCQAQLASNAPKDHVISMKQDDGGVIAGLVHQARFTWPPVRTRFELGLPKGNVLFVSLQLVDSDQRRETVFIRVLSLSGDRIKGMIASDLESVHGFKAGQTLEFAESAILDWTISRPDGSEEGNLIGKYLESRETRSKEHS